MESKEFERLVKLALSGNEDAFTDLFNETERMVYSMCKNILRNNEDAEDAMQETFVKAFKTLKDLKEPARFPGWLKTIATTTALDMYKKRRERHSDLNVDIAIEAGDLSEADDNLENLPEDYIMNEENRKIIRQIAEEVLNDVQFQTVWLYYSQSYTIPEIAEIMGVPEGTVKSRLKYARVKIKEKIKMYEKDNDDKLGAKLPFLTRFFIEETKDLTLPAMGPEIAAAISEAAAAGTAAGASFISTVAGKALIGVIGAAILGGGIFGIYKASSKNAQPEGTLTAVEETATPSPTGTPTPSPTPTIAAVCEINEETFPDPVFRTYILENADRDSDGYLTEEEVEKNTVLELPIGGTEYVCATHGAGTFHEYDYALFNSITTSDEYNEEYDFSDVKVYEVSTAEKISSLKGIEYLTNLKTLKCSNHNLTEVDLSQNTKLKNIDLSYNNITSLDVTGMPDLEVMNISCTAITNIDISQNTKLITLKCASLMDDVKGSGFRDTSKIQEYGFVEEDGVLYENLKDPISRDRHLYEMDIPESDYVNYIKTKCVEYLDISNNPALTTLYIDSESMGTTLVGASDTLEIIYTAPFSPGSFRGYFSFEE